MYKVAIYCELNFEDNKLTNVSYELISKAFELKNKAFELVKDNDFKFVIDAVVAGEKLNDEEIKKIYSAGADRIILIKNQNFKNFDSIIYSKAYAQYFKMSGYDCILFPATTKTRMVAPRITTILNTGLVADCTGIDFILKDGNLKLAPTRPTFGAELMATILSKKNPQCATVRPKTFEAVFNNKNTGEYLEFPIIIEDKPSIKVLSSILQSENEGPYFENAKIIFACGYGIYTSGGEYFEKIKLLAQKLNAKVASTRKLVDFNFMPQKYQVGQTGQTVNPDLYIAFGISGAIQHICGMKNSKTIVAINNDKNAEIFKYSDFKIVADAKEIIDELYDKYCV